MRYMGGKYWIAKRLAALIDCARRPGQLAWDPFCGGLSTSVALSQSGPVRSSDRNAALITLYNAVRNGWQPPEQVTRSMYRAARALPDSEPLKAFCGYGCSFSGRWFAGYVKPSQPHLIRSGPRKGVLRPAHPHRAAARSIQRDVAALRGAPIEVLDFLSVDPHPIDAVIYCDPPYRGTTGFPEAGTFDHDRFIDRVRGWSRYAHVFVSEYAFPIGREIWAHTLGSGMNTATERLYFLPAGSAN